MAINRSEYLVMVRTAASEPIRHTHSWKWYVIVFGSSPARLMRDIIPSNCKWKRKRMRHAKIPRVELIDHFSTRLNVESAVLGKSLLEILMDIGLTVYAPFCYNMMRPHCFIPLLDAVCWLCWRRDLVLDDG